MLCVVRVGFCLLLFARVCLLLVACRRSFVACGLVMSVVVVCLLFAVCCL